MDGYRKEIMNITIYSQKTNNKVEISEEDLERILKKIKMLKFVGAKDFIYLKE